MDEAHRNKWRRLVAAWDSGKTMCAIELGQQYLRNYPKDGAAWLLMGDLLTGIARYEEAIAALRKAMRLAVPEHLDMAYRQMGTLYRERGKYRIAERWFRKAMDANPKSTRSLIFLGAVLAKQGRFAEAKRYHRRAAGLAVDTWDEAYFNRGLILRAERKYEAALECFDKAVEIDPKYEMAKKERSDVLEAMKIKERS